MDKPLLIATADLHLSEAPPAFRSAEPDWYAAQARQLRWLSALSKQYVCPIVIAGDVFDKAIGTTRLSNFAADECPFAYAIAGNHDLPYHRLDKISISLYGSLLRAKKLIDIDGVLRLRSDGVSIALHGFPYGLPLRDCRKQADIDIAVVHRFVWNGRSKIVNILAESHLNVVKQQLRGYDFYIFGDNHGGFVEGNVINCGAFYRRMKGGETWFPTVGLIYRDRIETMAVPVGEDVMSATQLTSKSSGSSYDFSTFFDSLRQAEALSCDVEQLLKDYLLANRVEPDVHHAIMSITES